MSLPSLHVAHPPPQRAAARSPGLQLGALLTLVALGACGGDGVGADSSNPDGSFGMPAEPSRDASLDAALSPADAAGSGGPSVYVRFVHAIPNLDSLVVCHDPDGPGPMSAYVLRSDTEVLRASFGTRSDAVLVPALTSGSLYLQRDASAASGDAGWDAGTSGDGGAALDACDASLREATVPLPITGSWLSPSAPFSDDQLATLDLSATLSGAQGFTLFGTGVALNDSELDRRAAAASSDWLAANPSGQQAAADQAGMLVRDSLVATFGARTLIQPDLVPSTAGFTLSVLHALPDVPPSDPKQADSAIGALRLCVTAASRDLGVLPKPPALAIPFRVRTSVGDSFDPSPRYDFRVFADSAFDTKNQDCATTSSMPLASASFMSFEAGHSYTLAVVGTVAPVALCSANDVSLARASCSVPANQLGARITLLKD